MSAIELPNFVGDPASGEEVEMGPVVSSSQRDRVLGFLNRSRQEGARIKHAMVKLS